MSTYWLNFHVDYACRHSGVCCTSGWPIPVEHDRVTAIQSVIDRADTHPAVLPWLVPAVGAPPDVAGSLAFQPNGHCVFHGGDGGCRVHRSRPASCAHFPYVCLIDPRGVRVTLSHYCPSAASMLFEHRGPVEIVEGPAPVAGLETPEGLDARESLPPLQHGNDADYAGRSTRAADDADSKHPRPRRRLLTFDEFSQWEKEVVRTVGARVYSSGETHMRLFEFARAAVPAPFTWPEAPDDLDRVWTHLVEPAWTPFAAVVHRYLAAKLFAAWAAYLGDGIPAILRTVEIARMVLRVEVMRQCARADRALDANLLKEAIRQSDLLLVHYADSRVLSSANTP